MISLKDLNNHTYPNTKFSVNKNNELCLDLGIEQNNKKVKPIVIGKFDYVTSDDFDGINTVTDHSQTKNVFGFLTKSLNENIRLADEKLKEHIEQYPNAQAFIDNLPPEVVVSSERQKGYLTIFSDNKIVKQNAGRLNKFLFNFISDIATGEVKNEKRVEVRDVMKILNKKRALQVFTARENKKDLYLSAKNLVLDFNSRLDNLIGNEKFLNFIKHNKNSIRTIINTPKNNRTKLIELAEKRLEGRDKLEENCKKSREMFSMYTDEVAKNIFTVALIKARKDDKSRQISGIIQSLQEAKKKNIRN